MSEIAKLLRLQSPADKEIATSAVEVTASITGELFASALTGDNSRKRLIVHNATNTSSGELYFGGEGVTSQTGMLIEKGAWIELPIGTGLDIYFVKGPAGDGVNIRVVELA